MNDNLRSILLDPVAFSRLTLPKFAARNYQTAPMRAIWESVVHQQGKQFVTVFSRQAGKDESLAQLVVALLSRHRIAGGSVVIGAPTKEQATITLNRIYGRALQSPATKFVTRKSGDIVSIGCATAETASAEPSANPRGKTASLLLVANEAQDIDPAIWDARFDPMAASTNATTLYMGTVWDADGLLARQMQYLESIETPADRRVFRVTWREVAEEVPAYGNRVQARIDQLGANHPFIKTEYDLIPLDGEGSLFSPAILGQLQGDHDRLTRAAKSGEYALLIDVAGEEERDRSVESFDTLSKRDSTAATVIEFIRPDGASHPSYRVVDRRLWTGVRHTQLLPILHDLALNTWRVAHVAIDQTGVGAGLTSMMAQSLTPHRINLLPVHWTSATKSQAAWDLLAMIETGRLKEYRRDADPITDEFWFEIAHVDYELLSGPGRRLKWSVPVRLGHDDLLMSMALITQLDAIDLRKRRAVGTNAARPA